MLQLFTSLLKNHPGQYKLVCFPFVSWTWSVKLQSLVLLYWTFFKLCKFLDVLLLAMELVQLLIHHLPDEHLLVICQFCRPRVTKPLWKWGSPTIFPGWAILDHLLHVKWVLHSNKKRCWEVFLQEYVKTHWYLANMDDSQDLPYYQPK